MTSPYSYIAAGYQQVAFVVRDIDEAERFFSGKLGVPRFCRFNDIQVGEPVYRGGAGEFRYHLSMAYAGETAIELIQHLSGKSIYQEFLDRRGEGVHHLGFVVPDHDQAVQDFAGHGYPVVQGGRIGGSCFAYYDTQDAIGVFLETIMLDDEGRAIFARIKRGEF